MPDQPPIEPAVAEADADAPPTNCKLCDADIPHFRYGGPEGDWMRAHGECFTCAYWQTLLDADIPQRVIAKGVHYVIGATPDPHTPPALLGFGGTEFRILFKDGREVSTRNLWYQGPIPERFYEQAPDNAISVSS